MQRTSVDHRLHPLAIGQSRAKTLRSN